MNSNFIIFILVLIIIYMYTYNCKPSHSIKSNSLYLKSFAKKIKPSEFNPAIHHPAML